MIETGGMEDVLVIGAGIFGLTLARKLRRAGRSVVVAEAGHVGSGASATPLGVLAPHAPDNWTDVKEAQFHALVSLPEYLRDLEQETGIGTGYVRCGRLVPLATAHRRSLWQSRIVDAERNWRGVADLRYLDQPDPDWLSPDAAPFGAMRCGLTARIDARAYLTALAATLDGTIRCGLALERLEPGAACFGNGERIAARHIVLATGAEAFPHLPETEKGDPAGRGEKGQAALLEAKAEHADRPLLFHDGTWVVPRGGRRVAVGATSERAYIDARTTDSLLDERIDRARALCPALSGAKEIERWAAARPRAANRGLLVGPHPTLPGVSVATGGFKTGLALAHTLDPDRVMAGT